MGWYFSTNTGRKHKLGSCYFEGGIGEKKKGEKGDPHVRKRISGKDPGPPKKKEKKKVIYPLFKQREDGQQAE